MRLAAVLALAGTVGCAVHVASLSVVTTKRIAADRIRSATSRGWRDGHSCRFWLVGLPFGLPKVDEAIDEALAPVGGIVMRNVTVTSAHSAYVLFGWHCYRVRGEVFG